MASSMMFRINTKYCSNYLFGTLNLGRNSYGTFRLLNPISTNIAKSRYCSSTLADQFKKATAVGSNRRPLFWTSEADPAKHTSRHEGFYYTIPGEDFKRWLRLGLCEHFYKNVNAFQEACLMVRKPSLELIHYLRGTNFSLPVIRYVLFGRLGTGKSTSLAHVMHYCGTQGWVVVHVPWTGNITRYYREIQTSAFDPSRVDLPIEAAEWLGNFRKSNETLIKALNLKTLNQYTWTKREISEVGTPLLDLIEFGLTRIKFSTDVMGVILKELRLHASKGDIKLLVAVDGVNGLWIPTAAKREENRTQKYHSREFSMVQFFERIMQNDWTGGAVVCTVDGNAAKTADLTRYLPLDLLDMEGFEKLDPFVPIRVDNFTDKELYSCVEYLMDRKWILNPHAQTEEGRQELMALSSGNPLELHYLSVNW